MSYLYSSNTPLTKYTYTGQYSYVGDFGLHFYREASRATKWRVDNARWYDPSLGRFAQADTIVPGGIQGLDRYAYVNNSPVMYIDPSGHRPCDDEFECSQRPLKNRLVTKDEDARYIIGRLEKRFNINIEGPWTFDGVNNLRQALDKLSYTIYGDDQVNYWIDQATSGEGITFLFDPTKDVNIKAACAETSKPAHACWRSDINTIEIDAYAMTAGYIPKDNRRPISLGLNRLSLSIQTTLVHEIMHAFLHAEPSAEKFYANANLTSGNNVFPPGTSTNESLATSLAIYVVSGGIPYLGYEDQTQIAGHILLGYFAP